MAILTSCGGFGREFQEALEHVPEIFPIEQSGFELKYQQHSMPWWVTWTLGTIVSHSTGNFHTAKFVMSIVGMFTWKSRWLEGELGFTSRLGFNSDLDPYKIDSSWRILHSQES